MLYLQNHAYSHLTALLQTRIAVTNPPLQGLASCKFHLQPKSSTPHSAYEGLPIAIYQAGYIKVGDDVYWKVDLQEQGW